LKLSSRQVEQLHDKIGIDPLPDGYQGLSKLRDAFGDHTFYLTADGLVIWEYTKAPSSENQEIVAVRLASWANEEKSDLAVHEPRLTDVTVVVAADADAITIAAARFRT